MESEVVGTLSHLPLHCIAGDDNRLLVAQITTDGLMSASLRAQIFPDGDQVNDVRAEVTLDQDVDRS